MEPKQLPRAVQDNLAIGVVVDDGPVLLTESQRSGIILAVCISAIVIVCAGCLFGGLYLLQVTKYHIPATAATCRGSGVQQVVQHQDEYGNPNGVTVVCKDGYSYTP